MSLVEATDQEVNVEELTAALPQARNAMCASVQNEKSMAVIKGLLIGSGMNPMQFLGAVIQQGNALGMQLTTQQSENRWTITSFKKCVFNCAVIGLLPGEALGHAYFVPYTFNRGKQNEYQQITLIPGYRGLLELAFAANYLEVCQPEVVLKDEDCKFWHDTDGPQVLHQIPIRRGPKTKENVVAAYCTYRPKGGHSTLGRVIECDELQKLASGAGRRSPWNTGGFAEMSMKTSVRRTSKQWRLTRQLAQAIELDEQVDRNEIQSSLVTEPEETQQETVDLDSLPESEGGNDAD